MVVYMISCLLEAFRELRYVGQTRYSLKQRMSQHKYGRLFIDEMLRLFGDENFKVEIIEECCSREELDAREQFRINELGTF